MIFKSSLKHEEKSYFNSLLFLLLIIMLLPSIPGKFGNSLIPSVLVFFMSLTLFFTGLRGMVLSVKLIMFWVGAYFAILIAGLLSDEKISIGDLSELLVPLPTMLLSFWILNKFQYVNESSLKLFLDRFLMFSLVSALCMFLVAFMEFRLIYMDWLYFLYKPFDKYEDVTRAVTFFSYPYYATFYNLMLLSLVMPLVLNKPRAVGLLCVFLLLAVNLMGQSTTGLLSVLIYLTIMLYFNNKSVLYGIVKLVVLIVFLLSFAVYAESFLDVLIEKYDLYSLRVARKVLFNPEESGTLNTRLEQIYISLDATAAKGYLAGGGWGREMFLESFTAYSLYKFGFAFTVFLVLLWCERLVALYRCCKFFRYKDDLMFLLSKSLLAFFIVLPLLSSSSFLFFRHKVTLLFLVVVMITYILERNKDRYRARYFGFNENGVI